MDNCDICGIDGAPYKMRSPEGKIVGLCENCKQSCAEDYEEV